MKVGMKVGIKFNKIKQNKTIYLIDQGLFACLFIYLAIWTETQVLPLTLFWKWLSHNDRYISQLLCKWEK